MNCNCLCEINHPKVRDICTADAYTEITFDAPLTGRVDVSMCAPCVTATLADDERIEI